MWSVLYQRIVEEMAAIDGYVVPEIGQDVYAYATPPPRLMMWPDGDQIGEVVGPGGNPRPIKGIAKTSAVVLWGESFDVVEGMRDQLIVAVHRAVAWSNKGQVRASQYTIGPGKWNWKTLLNTTGIEYTMSFTYTSAVVMRTWAKDDAGRPVVPDASQAGVPAANTYSKANVSQVDVTVGVSDAGAETIEVKS